MGTILKINKNEYVYDETLNKCFDKDSNFVRPEIIINEILEYINEHNLNISIFGSGDQEYGIDYDFKVVRGFNETLYETFDKNSRIEGVLECFEWIKNKKLIEGIK